jgi:hypothetical protein
MSSFNTLSEVEAWARENGGLDAVNEALARGAFGTDAQSIRTALRYVEREELKIAERLDRDVRRERAMSAAEMSAQAAQRSAREAYVSRWIAVVAALITVLAALYTMMR